MIRGLGRNVALLGSIANLYCYCREICILRVDRVISTDGPIRGQEKIIEVDKMKFGKRKKEGWRKNVKGYVV